MNENGSPSQKLSRKTKILYGVGDTGFSLTDTTRAVLFAIFLTDVVGLRPSLAAGVIFFGLSWDYINDPLFGYISDRTRTRWGRRRPFLLFGFIPFGLSFAALWWLPPISSQIGLAIYYSLAFLFYEAAATFVYMPFYALTPELTQDYDERTSLSAYRMAFSLAAGLVAFTLPLAIIGSMQPENADKVFLMGILFGIASALPLLLTFFGTRERLEYQSQPKPKLKESLRAVARNRPFIFSAGIFLFTWAAIEIIQNMMLYFLKYRMNLEPIAEYILGTIFIVALITIPFWDWASRRLDKRLTYIAGMIFLSSVMIVLSFINPNWGLAVVFALAALAGIGVGGVHVLTWAIVPDAIEWDELHSGQRHEGIFYSLISLLRKISASFVGPMALLVLGWSGFVPNAAQQSESAVRAIQFLFGVVPSISFCLGIAFAIAYPISRQSHTQLRQELESRRQSRTSLTDG